MNKLSSLVRYVLVCLVLLSNPSIHVESSSEWTNYSNEFWSMQFPYTWTIVTEELSDIEFHSPDSSFTRIQYRIGSYESTKENVLNMPVCLHGCVGGYCGQCGEIEYGCLNGVYLYSWERGDPYRYYEIWAETVDEKTLYLSWDGDSLSEELQKILCQVLQSNSFAASSGCSFRQFMPSIDGSFTF